MNEFTANTVPALREVQTYAWALLEYAWTHEPQAKPGDEGPGIDRTVVHVELGTDANGDPHRLTRDGNRHLYLETYVPDSPGRERMIAHWPAQRQPLQAPAMAGAIHETVEALTRRTAIVRRLRRRYPVRTGRRPRPRRRTSTAG